MHLVSPWHRTIGRLPCPRWALLLAMVLLLFPALAAAQNGALPLTVADESAGDWVVSRYAGNSTAGFVLTQGPAREVGGLGPPSSMAFAPDGRVFMAVGPVVEVSADGVLRLSVGGEGSEAAGAPEDVYGGDVAWHPIEKRLFLGGRGCLRRLVEEADGNRRVEVVVGDPTTAAHRDGPAGVARLGSVSNVLINAAGSVFFFDLIGSEQSLRMYRAAWSPPW